VQTDTEEWGQIKTRRTLAGARAPFSARGMSQGLGCRVGGGGGEAAFASAHVSAAIIAVGFRSRPGLIQQGPPAGVDTARDGRLIGVRIGCAVGESDRISRHLSVAGGRVRVSSMGRRGRRTRASG